MRRALLLTAVSFTASMAWLANAAQAATISLSCGAVGAELKLCQDGAQAWAKQSGHEVKVVSTPNSATERLALYQQILAAGSADIDVFQIDVIWPGTLANHMIDLKQHLKADSVTAHFPAIVENNTVGGKLVGMPWYTDAGLLYYRKDLLEKAGFSGPPATWDELKEQANQIMQDEGMKFGFVFQGAEYEGGTVNGLEFINSHGGQVLDPNDASKVVIDSPESVAGLETEYSMVTDGVSPQAVSTYAEPECEAPFLGGDAVFCRNWPYMYSLAGTGDFIEPELIDIAPLPAGEGGESVSGLGGWNFFINAFADTEAQDAAWEFVQYMTAPEQQKFYALGGSYLPTLTALYNDPEIKENVPTVRLGAAALKNTVPRPVSPVYSDMSLKMSEEFNASLGGDTDPQQAISSLQSELQSIADQAPS